VRFRNEDVPTVEDKVNMVMSSSAIPIFFPFIEWRDTQFVDGGALKNFDVVGGIEYCTEKGFKQEDIIVDAVLCYNSKKMFDRKIKTVVDVMTSTLDLELGRFFENDINEAKENYPKVDFRYIISPSLFLKWDLFVFFDQKQMKEMYAQAQIDTRKAISAKLTK